MQRQWLEDRKRSAVVTGASPYALAAGKTVHCGFWWDGLKYLGTGARHLHTILMPLIFSAQQSTRLSLTSGQPMIDDVTTVGLEACDGKIRDHINSSQITRIFLEGDILRFIRTTN